MNRRILLALCIVICLGYFFVGLWPFNFVQHNRVEWLPDGLRLSLARKPSI
jgi:hypothetical protein